MLSTRKGSRQDPNTAPQIPYFTKTEVVNESASLVLTVGKPTTPSINTPFTVEFRLNGLKVFTMYINNRLVHDTVRAVGSVIGERLPALAVEVYLHDCTHGQDSGLSMRTRLDPEGALAFIENITRSDVGWLTSLLIEQGWRESLSLDTLQEENLEMA